MGHFPYESLGIIVAVAMLFFPMLFFIYFPHGQTALLHNLSPPATGNLLVQVLFYLTLLTTHNPKDIPLGFRLGLAIRLGFDFLLIGVYCFRHKKKFASNITSRQIMNKRSAGWNWKPGP